MNRLNKCLDALKSIQWITGYKDENGNYFKDNQCTADRGLIEEALVESDRRWNELMAERERYRAALEEIALPWELNKPSPEGPNGLKAYYESVARRALASDDKSQK